MNNKWKAFLEETKDKKGIYSFDFDNTLTVIRWFTDDDGELTHEFEKPNKEMVNKLRELAAAGNEIVIVTSRNEPSSYSKAQQANLESQFSSPEKLVADLKLPVSKIYYTNGAPKVYTLEKIGAIKHFDDDEKEIEHITQFNRKHPENPIEAELVQ